MNPNKLSSSIKFGIDKLTFDVKCDWLEKSDVVEDKEDELSDLQGWIDKREELIDNGEMVRLRRFVLLTIGLLDNFGGLPNFCAWALGLRSGPLRRLTQFS